MGLELIYTSAKKGLKPGSVGFCTVAMSRQMSPTLAATLESLSGYRHLYTAGNGNYADNPVNFCHYLIPDRGRVARVIARIGAAPADYTGRTNKLAHFMVLDSVELPLAGPAWLLERRGLMQEVWQGEPRLIESAAIIPSGDSTPTQCAAWQRVTGDAGWAGELLRRFWDQPEAPVHVICKPATNLLELFAEALALLPAEVRWQIAFSTYFTGHPVAGIKCHWRGIIAGTAATEGTLDPKSIIDVTRPLGRAPDGPCHVAARDGTIIDLSPMRSPAVTMEAPITLATPPALPGRKAGAAKPVDTGVLDLSPLAPERKATRFLHPHNLDQTETGRRTPRKRRWILPVVLGAMAFVILAVVGATFLIRHLGSARQLQQAMVAVGSSGHEKPTVSPVPVKGKPAVLRPPAKAAVVAPQPLSNSKKTPNKTKTPTTLPAKSRRHKSPGPAHSGEPPNVPAVNPVGVHYTLLVVNNPIFANSASGFASLGTSTPTAATKKIVRSFLVRFPPPVKAGNLILVGNPNVDPGKWKNVRTLPATENILRVWWKPNSNAGAGGLGLSVGKPTTLAEISVSKAGILTVHPGSKPGGPGLLYVEQMVVDVRLKNGTKERIQFLPSGPATTAVHLNKEAAASFAVKIPPQLQADGKSPESMALKVERSNNAAVWIAGKAVGAVYNMNLAPATRDQALESLVERVRTELAGEKPGKARILPILGPLKVGVKTSAFTNNYAALMGHLQRLAKKCEREVKLAEKHLKTHKALSKKQHADLARYKKHPKKNKFRIGLLKRQRDLHRDLAQLVKALKGRLNRMEQRLEHLKSLAGTTFRVELYPGGPVLERFTFKRGGG